MISKKKTMKKRHDGTVSFKSEEISIARCQVDARIAEQNKSSTGNDANTNAKKKRSRFVVTSIAESQKSKEVCPNLTVNECLQDSCDLTITQPTTDNANNREIDGLNSQPYVGAVATKSGSDETRRGARTLERTRKISSVLQPIQSLIELDESRKEPYIVQSLIYCQQHNPLIHLSPAQIIPINLLASNPRRTASHCVLPFDIPFDGRLTQVRDRSVPSLRRSDARLYEKYNVGLATAKENLRRYCLNRMTESSSKSTHFMESSMSVGNRVSSTHEMCQNEGICDTFTAPIESVTLFSNDCKEMQPIQHCATIVEDQRPEIPLAHLPSLPIASMIIPSESQHLPRINTPVNQLRPQQQQQPQQKPIAAIDKQKLMLNRRRQSDLGSIAMMQRKIKVNGTTDVINFDDLRERLEQLTGTTCCSNSGVNCSSVNKKSVDNKNGATKISNSSSRSKLTGQGEATPAARNQRHNSIAVVESRDVDRSLDVSMQSQDITTPLKSFPSATSSPCTNLQHSQSTMALSSLVTASTQTNAEIQATPRRHSNDQFNNSPLNFIDPLEVGVLGGSLLDDSLSLDDVVALIHAGEPLYDVTTEDSFWQLLAEGFESGRFQIASKEEANGESLFECSYDEELDKVDVVMVDSAEGATLSDELFQETLARQATERNTTRKRQARERYELHRWYVRHGRPPPRLILESIYFSAFFRKDSNKSLAAMTSSSSDPTIDETNSVSVVVVPDDDNLKIASESVTCSTVSSETVLEHSFEVPRPQGELGLKSMQQQSFSSEDDNYNSIDKHFNRSNDNDAVNFQGLMPPKSPWEVAYNKRAEQLAHLLQQQSKDYHQHQQLKNLQQQQQSEQQQWPSVADSLPENFMHQLQQLHKKKQQIISLTELLCQQQLHSQQQQQLHSQQQQQQANVVEQLSELLRCQLQQHDPCKSNPFSKHHEHPIGQDFLHRFHQNSTSEHLQRIQEFVANQKFLSENYSHLQPSPCSMVDPRICGSKLSNFDQPNLAASNSPNFNALHDVMAKLNYLQKNRCNFSPSTHKMSKPHPTMLHSPFQPICQEPSFQSINPSSGNLLFSLADRMALDGHPKQDKLCHNFMKSFHPSHDPITSFLSELYGQQNHQQLYYKQHQNLWDQMALLQHLQQPTLGAKQEYLNNLKSQPTTNAMPHGNISKLEEINNVLRGISTNQKIHSALSSDTSDAGSVYADPIQALLASLSSSLKS